MKQEKIKITEITMPRLRSIFIVGKLKPYHRIKIKKILKTMSGADEYVGYSPQHRAKRKAIEKIVKDYEKPKVLIL